MGSTVWILQENQKSDDCDHSEMLEQSKELDALCAKLNLPALSGFFDESILAEEFGVDVEPKYFDASIIKKLLATLVETVEHDEGKALLTEEMKDVISKCSLAEEKKTKVRLALIP